jgi:hypothetical protein
MLVVRKISILCIAIAFVNNSLYAQVERQLPSKEKEIVAEKPVLAKPKASENIIWTTPETIRSRDGAERKALSFEGCAYNTDITLLPLYTKVVKSGIKNIRITDAEYLELNDSEAALLHGENIGNSVKIETELGYVRRMPETTVFIKPFRVNTSTGKTEKLISFNIKYETETVSNSAKTLNNNYTYNSALSSGRWYKLAISADGIYKIDRNMLNSMGINTASINPRNIRIHGYGGGMLPQANANFLHDDLPENAIYVEGENDGVFNENDFVLFYAESPNRWVPNNAFGIFQFEKNIYSDVAFYYLTIGTSQGKRISNKPQESGSDAIFTYFNERQHFETDLKNLNRTGREWFGDEYKQTLVRTYNFSGLSNIVAGSDINIYSSVFTQSPAASNFTVKANGFEIGRHSLPSTSIAFFEYNAIGALSNMYFIKPAAQIPNIANLSIEYSYNKPNTNSTGYHNFTTINARRELGLYGNATYFRNNASRLENNCTFRINAPSNAVVWDLTNPLDIKRQEFSVVNSSVIEFKTATEGRIREYAIFNGNNFNAPTFSGEVQNQNLHALTDINFVIVSASDFLAQANQLANERNAQGLKTRIFTPQQIYEEFSSGRQDISAIRNFLKMLYDRSMATSTPSDDIRYLLLFGDCSYDYKNRVPGNTNFVPIYQSREYISQTATFSSDDYFGFLDDNEGEWVETVTGGNAHRLDIGIGRIPAKNATEANLAIEKIINYGKNNTANLGKWRNQITLIADDGDGCLHLEDAESFSRQIADFHPNFHTNKIYLDNYLQPYGATGQTSPECRDAINSAIERGALITNYTGHGNELKLASETIIDFQSINSWKNNDKLTFLVTGTCDFGRYDDPALNSGGEQAFITAKGGAIGLLTTTRPVYSFSNKILNTAFYNAVFNPINGNMPRLGDVQMITKNNSISGVNNRNFALLGDPTLTLSYPQHDINITKINEQVTNSLTADTLKALMKVTIEGEISDNGAVLTNFNGRLSTSVYEKILPFKTLGNKKDRNGNVEICDYSARKSVIFDGSATVTGGRFRFSFIVPKDINYEYGLGKIILYADNGNIDANGSYVNLIIGGSQEGVAPDNTPPVINLFMDDESFVFGGLTSTNTIMLGKLFDDNGINTSGLGIGHDITAILDDDINSLKVLNEYYTSELDNYQRGRIEYPYKELTPGVHSLRVKAWDTHNNSAEAYLEFVVANDDKLAIKHVLNYPNPFSTHTTFHYDHNRAGSDLETKIEIFTVTGKLIKTMFSVDYFSKAHFSGISWNGRDEYDDRIGNGVYIYKVTVRSLNDGSSKQVYEKLVILN